MKISKIEIKDFNQFKDLTIDLRYPQGHPKEGKPLDKICFIGQSGTGKTTLLELIPKFIYDYDTNAVNRVGQKSIENQIKLSAEFGKNGEYSCKIHFEEKNSQGVDWYWDDMLLNNQDTEFEEAITYLDTQWLNNKSTKLIYYSANLNFDVEVDSNNLDENTIIDFSKNKVSTVWNLILERIQSYQEEELKIRQEILKIVEQSSNDLTTIKSALSKLEDWKQNEFNPIEDIANHCLNPLLKPFKLKVKTELDIRSKDDIGFIKIEDYYNNEIPHGLWSTGTKQVILSALPLYLLKPKHTIILFDEPERSLYPDLQRSIIDYYYSLTKDCQFFYSTHSPIIASNFDPWEIVELKFNKENKVYRELYYEGENHIDNYKWNPKLMRWDDILQRVFDLENDGSDERKELLDKLAELNVKYKKLEKEGKGNSVTAKKISTEIQKLSTELSKWD